MSLLQGFVDRETEAFPIILYRITSSYYEDSSAVVKGIFGLQEVSLQGPYARVTRLRRPEV